MTKSRKFWNVKIINGQAYDFYDVKLNKEQYERLKAKNPDKKFRKVNSDIYVNVDAEYMRWKRSEKKGENNMSKKNQRRKLLVVCHSKYMGHYVVPKDIKESEIPEGCHHVVDSDGNLIYYQDDIKLSGKKSSL